MYQITLLYTYYWIAVYLILSGISIYGFRKLRRDYTWRTTLKYFGAIFSATAAFWAIWNLGLYLAGASSAESVKLALKHHLDVFLFPIIHLGTIFSVIIFMTQISGARILRRISYAVIFLILFATVGFFMNLAESAPPAYQPQPFPPGAKSDYLLDFLRRENLPSRLLVVDSPYANAWVSGNRTNQDVVFTLPAFHAMTKEELLSVMTHELGHKYEPHGVMLFKHNQELIGSMIGILYFAVLSGLFAFALKRPDSRLAKFLQLKVKDEDKAGNTAVIEANQRRFPLEMAIVLMLICAVWLPSLAFDNYLVKIEEAHADEAALRLLDKYDFPRDNRADGLTKMVNTNNAFGDNFYWLYIACFSDHPATSDRTALISNKNK